MNSTYSKPINYIDYSSKSVVPKIYNLPKLDVILISSAALSEQFNAGISIEGSI